MSVRPATFKWVWVSDVRRGLVKRGSLWGFAILGASLLAVALTATASGGEQETSRVPLPHPEIANPGKCVADTEYMRKHHMDVLLRHRDETVHEGIRTKRYSLTNCIDCHASRKNNSVLGTKENFCQACHTYAAVKVDCFECHSSKPEATAGAVFHPIVPSGAKAGPASADQGLALSMQQHMRNGLAATANKNPGGESR